MLIAAPQSASQAPAIESTSQARAVATEQEARAVCGTACHALPPPDILPRALWPNTVARMMLLIQRIDEPSGPPGTAARVVALTPEMQRVLRFYWGRAPEALPAPTPWPPADDSNFTRRTFSPPVPIRAAAAVSHVRFVDLDNDGNLELVAADMREGLIVAGRPWIPTGRLEVVADVTNAARFEPFDVDRDAQLDLLVADLGSFGPADHTKGAVVQLRRMTRDGFSPFRLDRWPRVADVRGGDFNADGKPDLAVAAFGWRKVGRMVVLENATKVASEPSFVAHVIDERSGGIHAVPVDLNEDGHLDIIGLIAQQHEQVVAYLNTGRGFHFESRPIYTAPHPNWGSSGIEVTDFDRDGDLDVLLAHGDTFDDHVVKPYHGIQWLENTGQYPFVEHTLADLPGVFGLKTGDLDGDGDQDVVASALLAGGSDRDESTMPALVWIEQIKPGSFARHTLARRPPRSASLDLGDFDRDGDLDIVVGMFDTAKEGLPWIELWENQKSDGQSPDRIPR